MKKKIAFYLASMRKGGAERVVSNLAAYFAKEGYQVLLVTTHRAEIEYEVPKEVVRILSEPSEEELRGGRIHNFTARIRKLRGIWKKEKPDVILSFIGKNNMMAVLTSFFLPVKVAVAVRGEPHEEYYSKGLKMAARHLFRYADGVILQTKASREFFPEAVGKKAVILKNPMNPMFFRKAYEGEREKTIVAVGRVDKNKNHELLIRAFTLLSEEFPSYRLIIYGEGEEKEPLLKLVRELGMEKKISLPGAVDDVAEVIYKTGVFVLSSNTEGMPNTLMEAMAMGLPVVSTDCPCGGPGELIEHGVNGLLTPVGNVDKMKENLQTILNDLQNAEKMGRRAQITCEMFRPEKVLREWEEYVNLL